MSKHLSSRAPSPQTASAVAERWFVSQRVLDADLKERPLAIGVAGGRIVRLCAIHELPNETQVTDYGSRPLVPAFVNAHTHLAMAPLRGITSTAARSGNVVSDVFFQIESQLAPGDVRAFAAVGAHESLLCGVAEVWDHYYFAPEVAEALEESLVTGTIAPTLQDLAGPGSSSSDQALSDTAQIASSARLKAAGISAALGPHASDSVSAELMAEAAQLARQLELPIHMHLLQSHEEVAHWGGQDAVQHLLATLDGLSLLLAHGLYLDRRDMERLIAHRATLAYCPLSQMQFGFPAPLLEWMRQGGGYGVGTDCVASNDGLDVQRELPGIAGLGSSRVSFSQERRDCFDSRSAQRAERVEKLRRESADSGCTDETALLKAAFGYHLPGDAHGLQLGAKANWLVLDAHHPSLFPGEDLVRTLIYCPVAGAIHQMVVLGKEVGDAGDFHRSVLNRPLYRHRRDEAQRRSTELFRRALGPAAP